MNLECAYLLLVQFHNHMDHASLSLFLIWSTTLPCGTICPLHRFPARTLLLAPSRPSRGRAAGVTRCPLALPERDRRPEPMLKLPVRTMQAAASYAAALTCWLAMKAVATSRSLIEQFFIDFLQLSIFLNHSTAFFGFSGRPQMPWAK